MYLKPTSTHIIPIYPSDSNAKESQVLSVDKHIFNRKNSNRKVAFLFSHATGPHKEMLHPVMRRFKDHLCSLKEYQKTNITFISWDDRHHGDSALLNEGRLDENHNPTDNAMDTKQLVDMFHLKTNYDVLVGVGHSMGASTLLLCEHYFPGTFDGLCLLEPIVFSTADDAKSSTRLLMDVVAKRREEWKDMHEFQQSSLSKNHFKAFHPEALQLFANYGVYKTNSSQTIRLKCSRNSEKALYRNSSFEAYFCSVALQNLNVPTQLVLANKSMFNLFRQMDLFAKLGGNIVVKVVDGTHMLPYEKPDAVIYHLMNLISRVALDETQSFKAMLQSNCIIKVDTYLLLRDEKPMLLM